MRKLLIGVGIVIVALIALQIAISALSPSDEVVVLISAAADGETHETTLWIVEDEGVLWLRAGNPDSAWLARVRQDPEIRLRRADQVRSYRVVPADRDDARDRVNGLMAEKYGASNTLVSLWGDHSVSVPLRLEADTAVGAGPTD